MSRTFEFMKWHRCHKVFNKISHFNFTQEPYFNVCLIRWHHFGIYQHPNGIWTHHLDLKLYHQWAISTFDAKGNTSRGTNLETGRGFFCRNWSWFGAAFSRFSWLLVSSGCLWSSAGTTFRPLGGVLAARACFWLCLECAAFSNLISW